MPSLLTEEGMGSLVILLLAERAPGWFIWFISLVWFVWFTDRTNEPNQPNQMNRIDQTNRLSDREQIGILQGRGIFQGGRMGIVDLLKFKRLEILSLSAGAWSPQRADLRVCREGRGSC